MNYPDTFRVFMRHDLVCIISGQTHITFFGYPAVSSLYTLIIVGNMQFLQVTLHPNCCSWYLHSFIVEIWIIGCIPTCINSYIILYHIISMIFWPVIHIHKFQWFWILMGTGAFFRVLIHDLSWSLAEFATFVAIASSEALGRSCVLQIGCVWKCCVPHCTQWFCWSLSRF